MTKVLEAVSTPTRGQARGTAGRAPAPPMSLSEAHERLQSADREEKANALIEYINALVREPSIEGAVGLARASERIRDGDSALAKWLDKQVDRVVHGARVALIEMSMRVAHGEYAKAAQEAFRREHGEHLMRQIEAYPKNGPRRSHEITRGDESVRFTTGGKS